MPSLDGIDRRRTAGAGLLGSLVGAATAAGGSPTLAPVLGALVAGTAVGLFATSGLDETPMESFLAAALTTVFLYLGVVAYAAYRAAGPTAGGDMLYMAGTFGWFVAAILLPVFGGLGYLGSRVGRPVGRRLRAAAA